MRVFNVSSWPYNPKRHFGRVGAETRDNFEGIKSVVSTVPDRIRAYKNLPKTYLEAKENFDREYLFNNEKEIVEDIKRKNNVACVIQGLSYAFLLFVPVGFYLDIVVQYMTLPEGRLLFSMENELKNILSLFTIWLTFLSYMLVTYKSFTARNRITMNPIKFLKVCFKYPSQLIPFKSYDDTMNSKYGDSWIKAIFKE